MRKIMSISYTKVGDYLLPNLKIVDKKDKENLNKYGLLRLNFIKKYRKNFYFQLIMEGKLYQYLLSVGKISEEKVNDLMQKFIKNDTNLSENFKEKDSLEWTKLMNNYKNIAEEIVINNYIFE
ncbi:MAG: TnpV protein [Firmicutes bacterium]|nr:TnpV protein [Bacillota bacterium]